MKKQIIHIILSALAISVMTTCASKQAKPGHQKSANAAAGQNDEVRHGGDKMSIVHLSEFKFNSLGIKVDTIPHRSMSGNVEANGQLEVPPQHEATVTAVLGANVTSIKVIEGDKIRKGQVLAYLSHPNLISLQTSYLKSFTRLEYLEKEFQRQKRLYDEQVGSGKDFQQIRADFLSMKGEVKGYEVQLKQLNLNVKHISDGELYEHIPVVSPIDGYIEKVIIRIGQYIEPRMEMFTIVNTAHIHADLMVFEKDVYRVREGQTVYFTVQSVPGETLTAEIFAVGKKFEQNPKAVHIHAEIKQKEVSLIPGMYINGKIQMESALLPALPEEAIIQEDDKYYLFLAEKHEQNGYTEWVFRPVEIRTGMEDEGWVEVKLLDPLPDGAKVALNEAYYLISELKKGESELNH